MADVTLDVGYGRKIVTQDFEGPAAYTTGGFDVRLSAINRILSPIVISNDDGWKVEIADCSWANNVLTIVVRCYEYNYVGECGPAVELPDGSTKLAGITFIVVAIGL